MKDILSVFRESADLRILVSRTDKIGDVILTLPLINEIKRLLPASKVFFLISKRLENLLDGYKDIDKIIYIEDFTLPELKHFIEETKISVSISVFPVLELAYVFFNAGVKHRAGTAYRWYSFLYNHRIKEHRKYAVRHESEYNLNLLSFITKDISYEKKFYFNYSDDEYNALKIKLSNLSFDIDKKFIILHPGSKGSALDLPVKTLKEFHSKFSDKFNHYNVALTGIKNEKGITSSFEKTDKSFDLAGLLSLREMMILTDKCSLFISNSTGPIHIAGALNKNIVGFYPNSAPMNPVRWKPLSENLIIITPENGDDMNSIPALKILKAAEEFL